jgi:hypothetical protein
MKSKSFLMHSFFCGVAIASLAVSTVAQAICNVNIPPTRPDSRYEALADATPAYSEVRDKVTGLVWQRCVVGMAWNATTCTGTPSSLTWQNALDAARTATASTAASGGAAAWRVPNHAELYGLAERACYNPAINTTLFPATPAEWTWSSSPDVNNSLGAWVVDYSVGWDFYSQKNAARRVRLVRSGQ